MEFIGQTRSVVGIGIKCLPIVAMEAGLRACAWQAGLRAALSPFVSMSATSKHGRDRLVTISVN